MDDDDDDDDFKCNYLKLYYVVNQYKITSV